MKKERDETNPITDHALLRYLQRELSIDVEGIRDEMASDYVRAACQAGATKIIIGKIEFRICRAGLVRTVVDKRPNRKTSRANPEAGKHIRRKRRTRGKLSTADRQALL